LLGHRKRATTAIYAHLDDAALQGAAAQAAAVIARAMGFRAELPSLGDEYDASRPDRTPVGVAQALRPETEAPVSPSHDCQPDSTKKVVDQS
ncbi:MAG: hypothetical protein OXU75_21015, partial [Deltaproteobacteria bacterium]|nr:hypothetical protein [Deltaproteobacteria bacterium]